MEESLYQTMYELIASTKSDFKRYLYDEILWESRMIGLVGPRGIGKTTMLLQRVKEQKNNGKYLYATADDLYFTNHTLVELAAEFAKDNGSHLIIDEVHKYRNWSRELKNIYDQHPGLHIIFTGSSILDIMQGEADLSRRALMFSMQGLSFREYLELNHSIKIQPFTLNDILKANAEIPEIRHPLPLFREYLEHGYYPFGNQLGFKMLLQQMVALTIEVDIPQYADMRSSTAAKLKMMLSIISKLAPYKPNMSNLATEIGVSKNNIQDYIHLLERAGLVAQLRDKVEGMRLLGKVEKVYLDNPNLMSALAENAPNIGNVRETFFFNQMRVRNFVTGAPSSDFMIDNYTFEVGGRNKKNKQIAGIKDAFIVKDDIEYAYNNVIPLWMFGLNY